MSDGRAGEGEIMSGERMTKAEFPMHLEAPAFRASVLGFHLSFVIRHSSFLVLLLSTMCGVLPAVDAPPNSEALPDRVAVAVEALSRLPDGDISAKPQIKTAVTRVLSSLRGRPEFVRLVQKFHLDDQNAGLLEIAVINPASDIGVEAMRLILAKKDFDLLNATLRATNVNVAVKTAEALGNAGENQTVSLLLPLVTDSKCDLSLRKQAIRSLAR